MTKKKTTGRRVPRQYQGEQRNAAMRDLRNQIHDLNNDRIALGNRLHAMATEQKRLEHLIAMHDNPPMKAVEAICYLPAVDTVRMGIHGHVGDLAMWMARRKFVESMKEFHAAEESKQTPSESIVYAGSGLWTKVPA